MAKCAKDWRVEAYPVQVRIYVDPERWGLYSRHRDWGANANRAYVEARNAHPDAHAVEIVDIRDERKK